MNKIIITVAIVIYAVLVSGSAQAKSFAEIGVSLGQIIDPALSYLECSRDLKWYEQIICERIAAEVTDNLNQAGISITSSGIVYTKPGFVPAQSINITTCDTVSTDDNYLTAFASRDTAFKFKFESLTTPLLFTARIPSNIYAKVNMHERIRTYYASTCEPEWYGCKWTSARCADPSTTDHFYLDASASSISNIAIAFSLEARLLPRATPSDDYQVEIKPIVYVDGYIENVDLDYGIHDRAWLFNTIIASMSITGNMFDVANDLAAFDFDSALSNVTNFSVNAMIYPLASVTFDPNGLGIPTEQLITDFLERRVVTQAYSMGLQTLEQTINTRIAQALNLNANGRYVFTVKKSVIDGALAAGLLPVLNSL